jgi:hypothetical protein
MTYYLGCECDAPLIAYSSASPGFYVSEPQVVDVAAVLAVVHRHLSFPIIRCLGSRSGCGCGFRCSLPGFVKPRDTEHIQEAVEQQSDHDALVAYLRSLPKQTRPMQIYGCWCGDESVTPEHFRTCSITDLASPDFAFRERELITLSTETPNTARGCVKTPTRRG